MATLGGVSKEEILCTSHLHPPASFQDLQTNAGEGDTEPSLGKFGCAVRLWLRISVGFTEPWNTGQLLGSWACWALRALSWRLHFGQHSDNHKPRYMIYVRWICWLHPSALRLGARAPPVVDRASLLRMQKWFWQQLWRQRQRAETSDVCTL